MMPRHACPALGLAGHWALRPRALALLSPGLALLLPGLALLFPGLALAHPSGLPALKERADFVIDNAHSWLLWDVHESLVIGTLLAVVAFTWAIGPGRIRWGWSAVPATPRQRGLFYGTMALMYLTLDGPLHHLADELLFSAHMQQHMILQLVWAPLIVIAVPPWLWRALLRPRPVLVLARVFSRPMTAFLTYNAIVFGWHIPPLYNLALTTHAWHIVQHLMFMSSAVLMWWVMIAPLPEFRATYARRMVFVLANMLAMKVLGLIISLSDEVLYTFYLAQPRAWGLDALGDQQLGGMLMWLPGGGLLWAGLGRVWWQWVKSGTPDKGKTGVAAIDAARAARAAQLAAAGPPP